MQDVLPEAQYWANKHHLGEQVIALCGRTGLNPETQNDLSEAITQLLGVLDAGNNATHPITSMLQFKAQTFMTCGLDTSSRYAYGTHGGDVQNCYSDTTTEGAVVINSEALKQMPAGDVNGLSCKACMRQYSISYGYCDAPGADSWVDEITSRATGDCLRSDVLNAGLSCDGQRDGRMKVLEAPGVLWVDFPGRVKVCGGMLPQRNEFEVELSHTVEMGRSQTKFRLEAVAMHLGGNGCGHYAVLVPDHADGGYWKLISDGKIEGVCADSEIELHLKTNHAMDIAAAIYGPLSPPKATLFHHMYACGCNLGSREHAYGMHVGDYEACLADWWP